MFEQVKRQDRMRRGSLYVYKCDESDRGDRREQHDTRIRPPYPAPRSGTG